MTLREIIEKANGHPNEWGYLLEYEVVPHLAGETHREIVDVEAKHENRTIYLEYE